MANASGRERADRCLRRAPGRHDLPGRGRLAESSTEPFRHLRSYSDRKASHICTRSGSPILRRANRARHHSKRGSARLPYVLANPLHRAQHAVSNEEIAVMIISKLALPRRTFLRGVGATLALPLLDAMVPALSAMGNTVAAPVRRLGFFYIPNGANMWQWTPENVGNGFTFSPTLKSLEPYRQHVVVLSGLDQKQAENFGEGVGEHARASAVWLNGVRPKRTEAADVRAGTTADQIAAAAIGGDTQLPSLELALEPSFMVGNCDNGYSCVYMNTLCWRTPTTPLPMENNPRLVFERMFGDGGSMQQRRAEMKKDQSILDSVTGDIARLQQTIGPSDRGRVNEYLDGVREVERRIQRAESQTQGDQASMPPDLQRPVGVPDSFEEHAKLMNDLQLLAFQADITRVITFQIGR